MSNNSSKDSSEINKIWYYFRRKKLAMAGLVIVAMIFIMAVFAPLLAPHDPHSITRHRFEAPGTADHVLGTDNMGRDILSRVIWGARVSLLVGILASVTGTIIGITLGAVSGYFGGWVDNLLMRITELFMTIPRFVLALVVISFFGTGINRLILVIGFLSWPGMARIVRSEYLTHKSHPYVESGRVIGMSDWRLIFIEILPNVMPQVVVVATLDIATAILLEAGLGFFGLGDPNLVSWGGMLSLAQGYLRRAWWMSVFPGLAISLAVLSFNLVGDGLNEATNPRLQSEGFNTAESKLSGGKT